MSIKSIANLVRIHILELLLVSFAIALTLMPFVFDGRYICSHSLCGLSIGTNYRDGVWFLAVAQTAFRTFPFQMPIYAGAPLQGYHYLPNLLVYILSKIGIPITVSYYQLIPLLYVVCMCGLLIRINKLLFRSRLFFSILVVCVFFGMHLAPFTSLYHTGRMNNSALINTFQATRLLESPHSALAFLMLLYVISYMYEGTYFGRKQSVISYCMLFLSLGTKVYFAFTLLGLLLLFEGIRILSSCTWKKIVRMLILGLVAIFGYAMFYSHFGNSSSPLFIFSPFATVHHLIESDGLFYQPQLVLARYYLYAHGMSPRLIAIELYSTLLFVLYYFGIRVIGICYLCCQMIRKKISALEMSMAMIIGIDVCISVIFIQRGDWYNPIQFSVPAAYMCALLTAIALYKLYTSYKKTGIAVMIIVSVITIPGNFLNIFYLQNPARFIIATGEVKALAYLKTQPEGSVFYPIDENDMAYVPAFTGKASYVNFVNVLDNTGIDYSKRLKISSVPERFEPSHIDVLYFYIPKRFPLSSTYISKLHSSTAVRQIFENESAVIFKKK